MSCEPNRLSFLKHVCCGAVADTDVRAGRPLAEELEDLFQRERARPENPIAEMDYEAKTRLLFAQFARMQPPLPPPTHSADGLPKLDARRGYAKLYERLSALAAQGVIPRCPACGQFGVQPGHPTCVRAPGPSALPGVSSASGTSTIAVSAMPAVSAQIGRRRAVPQTLQDLGDGTAAAIAAQGTQVATSGHDDEYDEYDEDYENGDYESYANEDEEHEDSADGGSGPNISTTSASTRSAMALARKVQFGASSSRHPGTSGSTRASARYGEDGYNQQGYNAQGYDRDGYDRDGFSYVGWDRQGRNRCGFDRDGYDANGRDWLGFGKDGFNEEGLDRFGYGRDGYDREGYNKAGYDKQGYNRRGYDRTGYNKSGLDYYGYNKQGKDANGWMLSGYKDGLDADGYDHNGLDEHGYDRQGYTLEGLDKGGNLHPWLILDAEGYYGDGMDAEGFDRNGYNKAGIDRWGFNRQGLNGGGRDRTGRSKDGFDQSGRDRDGYDADGYDRAGLDRLGYDKWGLGRDGYSVTGYDKDGYDRKGLDRHGRDRDNKDARTGRAFVNSPYNKSGYDKGGYDRWGFHRATGLTEDGRNYAGWVYDSGTKDCYNPANPAERMPHKWQWLSRGHWYATIKRQVDEGRVTWNRPGSAAVPLSSLSAAFPGASGSYQPKIAPLDPMSKEEWETAYGTPFSGASTRTAVFVTPVAARWEASRPERDPQATKAGVFLRCPHCGQFTGGKSHGCPGFSNQQVTVYRSFLAHRSGALNGGGASAMSSGDSLRKGEKYSNRGKGATNPDLNSEGVPANPHSYYQGPFPNGYSAQRPYPGKTGRDPRYTSGGYDSVGRDQEGFDRVGYNTRGFNRRGRDREGFDIFGFDEDGYDRAGYDRNDRDRDGNPRERHLDHLVERYTQGPEPDSSSSTMEGDLLANQGVANMYRQIVSALTGGQDWKVEFSEEGLGATNMIDTIWVNPYPLGRDVPPVANVAVTRGVLYHEMGHVLKTPPHMWQRALRIARREEQIEGLDGAAPMLPQVLNIVEDGRMERAMSAQYAGAAEAIAAGCRLFPRWDERVGPGVELEHQVLGALINECRPYYRLRQETIDAMTPEARALLEELRPLARMGVISTAEDTFNAAVEITKRLQAAGIEAPDQGLEQMPAFVLVMMAQGEEQEGEGGQGGGEGGPGGQQSLQGQSGQLSPGGQGASGGAQAGQAGQGASQPGQPGQPGQSSAGGQAGQAGNCPSCGRFVNSQGEGHADSCPQQGQPINGQSSQSSLGAQRARAVEGSPSRDQSGQQNGSQQGDKAEQSGESKQEDGGSAASREETSNLPLALRQFDAPFTDDDFVAALSHMEQETVKAVEVDLRRQGSVEHLGRRLHEPLEGRKERTISQAFRNGRGEASTVSVSIPTAGSSTGPGLGTSGNGGTGSIGSGTGQDWVKSLEPRRKQQERIADDMAYRLALVRDQVEERLGMQPRGDLDRSEFVAAVKGARDVYEQTLEQPKTSFAASVCVDLSGSMNGEMNSGALYDAVGVLAATFEHQSLQMPYEVRGFSDGSLQYKSIGDARFDPARHAMLIKGPGSGTQMRDTAGLATTALRARPERNKLLISLTDGALSDHNETAALLRTAREGGSRGARQAGATSGSDDGGGVLTFGIYLARSGETPPVAQLDDLYGGRGNWTSINSIAQMPERVATRIADIMQSL
jgi:hypothetical protein